MSYTRPTESLEESIKLVVADPGKRPGISDESAQTVILISVFKRAITWSLRIPKRLNYWRKELIYRTLLQPHPGQKTALSK